MNNCPYCGEPMHIGINGWFCPKQCEARMTITWSSDSTNVSIPLELAIGIQADCKELLTTERIRLERIKKLHLLEPVQSRFNALSTAIEAKK